MITTLDAIKHWPGLTAATRAALIGACAVRGKNAGYLLEAPPRRRTDETEAAWRALVSNVAPSRAGLTCLMFYPGMRDAFLRFDAEITTSGLDRALLALEPDFRWNMYALNHDTVAARARIAEQIGL